MVCSVLEEDGTETHFDELGEQFPSALSGLYGFLQLSACLISQFQNYLLCFEKQVCGNNTNPFVRPGFTFIKCHEKVSGPFGISHSSV